MAEEDLEVFGADKVPPGSKPVVAVYLTPNGEFDYLVNVTPLLEMSQDPSLSGILTADLVRHLVNALVESGRVLSPHSGDPASKLEIFARVSEVMMKELRTNEAHARRRTDD